MPITSDISLVAHCGLYCGACGAHLRGRCPGCHNNQKAAWCKVRTCCIEQGYSSCADCKDYTDPLQCKKYNNIISRIIGFILCSDRASCIRQIKNIGLQGHADAMAKQQKHTIKRGTVYTAPPIWHDRVWDYLKISPDDGQPEKIQPCIGKGHPNVIRKTLSPNFARSDKYSG